MPFRRSPKLSYSPTRERARRIARPRGAGKPVAACGKPTRGRRVYRLGPARGKPGISAERDLAQVPPCFCALALLVPTPPRRAARRLRHVALARRAAARSLRAPASRTSSLLRRETIRDANDSRAASDQRERAPQRHSLSLRLGREAARSESEPLAPREPERSEGSGGRSSPFGRAARRCRKADPERSEGDV